MYKLTTITPPAVEPVTYSELDDHLRTDGVDADLVTALGVAGREYVEGRTRTTLIHTTFDVAYDSFACALVLPRHPVSSITSVSYIDTAGSTQTLASSVYTVAQKSSGATHLVLKPGQSWPSTGDYPNAVTIRFVAGLGATSASVPEVLKLAIKTWAAAAYENREAVLVGKTVTTLPHAFDAMVNLHARPEV